MGSVLKISTVIVFLLSIVAFVFGFMNYNKRSELMERAHLLEESVIKIAGFIEKDEPILDDKEKNNTREEYDIDAVTDMPNDTPALSTFWGTYKEVYEKTNPELFDLSDKNSRFTLRQYFFKARPESPNVEDYENGVRIEDPIDSSGYKTDGAGTMRNLLQRIEKRAGEQYDLLGNTRTQLITVREELEKVIGKLNTEKVAHRESKAFIKSQATKIGELEGQIDGLNKKIAQLEREGLELNDEISSLESELAQKNEDIASQASEISTLKDEIKRLTATEAIGVAASSTEGAVSNIILTPGEKGEVVRVANDVSLVVVKLTDAMMKEILGDDLSGEFAPIEVMVIRDGFNGPSGNIVTRIRITRVSRDGSNIGYADNLYGWEQIELKEGDKVIY